MKTRIISACLMLPFLIIIWLGGLWLAAAGLVVSAIGLREFYKGAESAGAKPSFAVGYGSILVMYGLHLLVLQGVLPTHTALTLWTFLAVISSMIYGFNVEKRKMADMTSTLFGMLYVVLLFYHMVMIDFSSYRILIWLVLLASFGTDIFAYFVGISMGKHKLCPGLSPKKSVEGALGGMAGSVILCTLFGLLAARDMWLVCIFIGIFGSVAAQLGDLSASAFKRQMGIKDYGNLIPGHGGILDRFDSVLFVAPAVYYVITIATLIG